MCPILINVLVVLSQWKLELNYPIHYNAPVTVVLVNPLNDVLPSEVRASNSRYYYYSVNTKPTKLGKCLDDYGTAPVKGKSLL